MSSNITKGLSEAYKSVYSQENNLYENVGDFIEYLDESGYDISLLDEDNIVELFIICNSDIDVLNEGVEKGLMSFGQLASALEKAKKGTSALNISKQLASARPYVKPVQQAAQQVQQTAQKAPGFLQNLASGWQKASAAKQAEKAAKKLERTTKSTNPVFQKVQQKAGEKLYGLAKGVEKAAIGSLIAGGGVAGLGALDKLVTKGGVGSAIKWGLDTTRNLGPWVRQTRQQTDPTYNPSPRPRPTTDPAEPATEKPISLPAGYKMVNGKVVKVNEEVILVKYILDEGYATTEQQASVIVENMSDNWKKTILGDAE